jgi:hypothetical protein
MSLWLNFASLPVGRQGYVQNDILVVFNWAESVEKPPALSTVYSTSEPVLVFKIQFYV